jgi:hypothetical protein
MKRADVDRDPVTTKPQDVSVPRNKRARIAVEEEPEKPVAEDAQQPLHNFTEFYID